jgi:hypothetical protein
MNQWQGLSKMSMEMKDAQQQRTKRGLCHMGTGMHGHPLEASILIVTRFSGQVWAEEEKLGREVELASLYLPLRKPA